MEDPSLELLKLTKDEVEEAIDRNATLFVPTGSIEQHGPHLPLGTDGMIAFAFALGAAKETNGLVAPLISHGSYSRPASGGGRSFRASLGVPPATLKTLAESFLSEAVRQGFTRFVFLNAHYENAAPIADALEAVIGQDASTAAPVCAGRDPVALFVNWWDLLTDEDVHGIFGDSFPGWPAEHGGVLETSLMDYFEPDHVRAELKVEGGAERVITYERFPTAPDTVWPTGIGSTAVPTSAELGKEVADLVAAKVLAAIERDL